MRIQIYMMSILLFALLLFLPQPVLSDDNEIFGVVTQTVEPNILIIFDTSGSMSSNNVQVCEQDCHEEPTQNCINGHWEEGGCHEEEQCHQECTGAGCGQECHEVCETVTVCDNDAWVCDEYETIEICSTNCYNAGTRLQVAKNVINDLIDEHAAANRFGIMRFHQNTSSTTNGGYIPKQIFNGSTLVAGCEVKDYFILDSEGEMKTGNEYIAAIQNYKIFLHTVINNLPGDGNTPLKETLSEAGLYFAEKRSWYNYDQATNQYPHGTYPTQAVNDYNPNIIHPPIGWECRQNYIILMTDGEATQDTDSKMSGRYINGDYINNGNLPGLDDISGYLYENDINSNFEGSGFKQNIITYAIGFAGGDPEELQDTADRGMGAGDNDGVDDGGLYFDATDPESLADAFTTILASIDQRRTLFAASVVPISDVSKAYAGEYVYLSVFQPISGSSRWIGNLKKYSLNDSNDFASCGTQTPILDSQGAIKDAAQSCWSPSPDGAQVDKGGAGQILSNTPDANRNIYTNLGSNNLALTSNAFTTSNANILDSHFGVSGTTAKNTVINNIRMVDEEWKLGDLNHSKPAVAAYSGGSYVFVGSNDGMLHCFDDSNGSEKWAFVPFEQFSRLTNAYTGDHSYFIDGSPTIGLAANNEKILIVGERRGGNRYYAIDITNVNSPNYLYTKTTTGQSWKQPQFMTVKTGASITAEVFLLTAGYDDTYDTVDTMANPVGDSVFMINAKSGAVVETFNDTDIAAMTNSIVMAAGIDLVDDGKDIISQIYAGDMEGQLFGFRDNNDPLYPKKLDGNWQNLHLFSAVSTGKKMFEEVDLVSEYIDYYDTASSSWKTVVGDYVFFGTGDRADPLRTDTTDYFYCVKNDWVTENITVNKMVSDFSTLNDPLVSTENSNFVILDFTNNSIQDGTVEEKIAAKAALNERYNRGWFFELEGLGEKCLSTPLVYAGVVYFTTFTPNPGAVSMSSNPCENPSGGGTARLYAIDYRTGGAVYSSFDGDPSELGKEDRFITLNQNNLTIAPNPLIIITDKGEKLSIGPQTEDVMSPRRGVKPFYWIEE